MRCNFARYRLSIRQLSVCVVYIWRFIFTSFRSVECNISGNSKRWKAIEWNKLKTALLGGDWNLHTQSQRMHIVIGFIDSLFILVLFEMTARLSQTCRGVKSVFTIFRSTEKVNSRRKLVLTSYLLPNYELIKNW